MQKTTKFLMILIFIEIMFISIGYAAIGNCTFNISGTIETIPLISSEVEQSVFYYVGYSEKRNEIEYWTPGGRAKYGIVLHYDGIYKKLNGATLKNEVSVAESKEWSDLSGHGNHGKIVKAGEWEWKYESSNQTMDIKNFDQTVARSPVDNNLFTENSLKLTGSNYVVCDMFEYDTNSNITGKRTNSEIPTGKSPYTIEIRFEYTGAGSGTNRGLFGMGTYNRYSKMENEAYHSFRTDHYYRNTYRAMGSLWGVYWVEVEDTWNLYSSNTLLNINEVGYDAYVIVNPQYTQSLGASSVKRQDNTRVSRIYRNSDLLEVSSADAKTILYENKNNLIKNVTGSIGIGENGKSNSIKLNKNNQITSYYWGGYNAFDADTINSISNGKHTITVTYDGNQTTKIYLDGVEQSTNVTTRGGADTILREITIGASNMNTKVTYNDHIGGDAVLSVLGTEDWLYRNTLEANHKTTTLIDAWMEIYSKKDGNSDNLNLKFNYEELFSEKIYSVRIYDKELSIEDIKHNLAIDKGRFGE